MAAQVTEYQGHYRTCSCCGLLNYAVDPDPPLLGADKKWANEWLNEKGLRPRKKAAGRGKKPKGR